MDKPLAESAKTALVLISGGLDSILAALVLQEAGVKVQGVCFSTPFFGSHKALYRAAQAGLACRDVDITERHLAMLRRPRYGYGKNMNPCIDCHILMVARAVELLGSWGADFVATGEVLGERPMSQNRNALNLVALRSGAGELLLRPLSARLLDETLPERNGWVRRESLLALSGRSRRPQFELAARFGVTEFETPAGGCLLTDASFSERLRELMQMQPCPGANDIELLKKGRHFRSGNTKIVLGRNQEENELLLGLARPGDALFCETARPGPTALIRPYEGSLGASAVGEAARLLGLFGKGKSPLKIGDIVAIDSAMAEASTP